MADLEWPVVAAACRAPAQNVLVAWPLVLDALREFGVADRPCQVAAAATIATETGDFTPKRERRASANRQPDLYRLQERYWPSGYYGRGFIQLTWEENYRRYGERLGVDLAGQPDLALEPSTAARILAAYLADRDVGTPAGAGDWRRVRKIINGGYHGWDTFAAVVAALTKEVQ